MVVEVEPLEVNQLRSWRAMNMFVEEVVEVVEVEVFQS